MGCWCFQGARGSGLERELVAMLGPWQRQVDVGTSLRRAADTSAHAAHSGARVKMEGGQRRLLHTAHVAGGARKNGGGQRRLLHLW
jgi:hypothetical protein